jgi:hypothetical protein
MRLDVDREYLVYYLDQPDGRILLSLAPSDHEDAATFAPSDSFRRRFARRDG